MIAPVQDLVTFLAPLPHEANVGVVSIARLRIWRTIVFIMLASDGHQGFGTFAAWPGQKVNANAAESYARYRALTSIKRLRGHALRKALEGETG